MKDNNFDTKGIQKEREEEFESLKTQYLEPQMSQEQLDKLRLTLKKARRENRRERNKQSIIKIAASAAAAIITFIVLPNTSASIAHAMEQIPMLGGLVKIVTLRDYEYESERYKADIKVPEIVMEEVAQGQGESDEVQNKIKKSIDEINVEIQSITDEIIEQFENETTGEAGYQDVVVTSEVLATTQDYFTLKVICYRGAGSGYEWNYYYTVDLTTGERLKLKDLFPEGADYITPISENIKQQMQEQMDADDMVRYWLNEEFDEWNFKSISDETSFYLNEKGNIVIGFNEGEVAPMYMGTVEFEIPASVSEQIAKNQIQIEK